MTCSPVINVLVPTPKPQVLLLIRTLCRFTYPLPDTLIAVGAPTIWQFHTFMPGQAEFICNPTYRI